MPFPCVLVFTLFICGTEGTFEVEDEEEEPDDERPTTEGMKCPCPHFASIDSRSLLLVWLPPAQESMHKSTPKEEWHYRVWCGPSYLTSNQSSAASSRREALPLKVHTPTVMQKHSRLSNQISKKYEVGVLQRRGYECAC